MVTLSILVIDEPASGADADPRATGGNNIPAAQGQSSAPTLDQGIAALESSSAEQVETYLSRILDPDASVPGSDPAEFLPTEYEPGTTQADARTTLVFHVQSAAVRNAR